MLIVAMIDSERNCDYMQLHMEGGHGQCFSGVDPRIQNAPEHYAAATSMLSSSKVQAGSVVQHMGGVARDCEEIPLDVLRDVRSEQDDVGNPMQVTGLQFLLREEELDSAIQAADEHRIAGMHIVEGVLSMRDWPVLPAPFGGALPTDAAQYRRLLRTHAEPRTLEEVWRTHAFAGSQTRRGDFAD